MRYKIFENDTEINVIVADEAFVELYCNEHGYSYERSDLPENDPADPSVDAVSWDAMAKAIMEGVNEV